MLLKCRTQYASTFQNLSSGHRWVTWESQFSFQSQRKTVPKNIQTTIQLCLFYILAKLCFKSFKLGFSSMWTENFQMCKLGLEKAEEPELKLPAFVGSWRKQENSRKKKSTSTILTTLKPLTMHVCAQSGLTLCNHLDCSPPGSSVHEIFQASKLCGSQQTGKF